MDREVVYQYIQHPMIAKDFAAYLALCNKYKTDYAVEDLLQGKWTPITLGKIRNASLDEHLSIVGLLNGKLSQLFADCYFMDAYVTKLYGYMTEYRDNLPEMTLESIYKKAENDFQTTKKTELLTKNEEKVLPRILKPMKEIVDKILICDTGSTDRTKEIIREFTAEVYDFPWKNDFSAARNFISEKVSTDYWMWLDADDMITQENLYRLKQLKETLSPNTDMVMMDYVTDFDEWNHAAFSCYRERILKTSRNFRWRGRVHESIIPTGNILYSPIQIEHRKIKPCSSFEICTSINR